MKTTRDLKVKREPKSKRCSPMRDKASVRHAPLKATMSADMARKCLSLQNILNGVSDTVIDRIMKEGKIVKYKKGQTIAKQGDAGECSFFILKGTLDVFVNGRKVAERHAKECVGEMSVLDPTQNRCATLLVAEEAHLLMVKSDFMETLFSDTTIP